MRRFRSQRLLRSAILLALSGIVMAAAGEPFPALAYIGPRGFPDGKARLLVSGGVGLKLLKLDGATEREAPATGEEVKALTSDRGPHAEARVLGYAVGTKEGDAALKSVDFELMTTVILAEKLPKGAVIGGLAVWNQRLVLALTVPGELWFIDARLRKLEARQSLPDFPSPRGVSFDARGRLWALSGNSLAELQFTEDGHFNPIHHRGDFDEPQGLACDESGRFFLTQRRAGGGLALLMLDENLKTQRETTLPARSVAMAGAAKGCVWTASSDKSPRCWDAFSDSWRSSP